MSLNIWLFLVKFIAANKAKQNSHDNFDIFLPEWLARHNKTIYTAIVIVLLCLYFVKR